MKKLFAFLFSLMLLMSFSLPAHAQLKSGVFDKYFFGNDKTGSGGAFGGTFEKSGKLEDTLPQAIGNIISIFLSLIGVILLVIMVYAGFLWLTAGGNEEQVKKAKMYIRNAVIGLTIALAAFVITSFVIQQVQQAVSETSATNSAGSGGSTGGKDKATHK
jgi:lysylphosphatidylglycerol synthetase-like protein (DUF2156 family)